MNELISILGAINIFIFVLALIMSFINFKLTAIVKNQALSADSLKSIANSLKDISYSLDDIRKMEIRRLKEKRHDL